MNAEIRARLIALADDNYRAFSAALLPGVDNILGVRIPQLRALAKEIATGDFKQFITQVHPVFFEETMLLGIVIAYAPIPLPERLNLIKTFIPKITNWSVCDSVCASFRFSEKEKTDVWEFILPYFSSKKEYHVRFAFVMLLDHFLHDDYIDRVLPLLAGAAQRAYYAQMAAAWALSVAYIKFPKQTLPYLNNNALDDFTHNKALQKICESRRINDATRKKIRRLKRGI